jgi:hypothetical protein
LRICFKREQRTLEKVAIAWSRNVVLPGFCITLLTLDG